MTERSRATGLATYLPELQLAGHAAHDAQGNHFDRHAIALGTGHLVRLWAWAAPVPAPRYPTLEDLEDMCQALRRMIEAGGIPAEPRAVRDGLRDGPENHE